MRLVELINKGRLDEQDKKEMEQVKLRIKLRKVEKLVDQAPGYAGDAKKGRLLFTERGCLACHVHQGTEEKAQGKPGDKDTYAPTLKGEAVFGPNLSQLSAKLGSAQDSGRARNWLIQWILDPQFHSPRSRMPVTHLTAQEAADVAAWLLAQAGVHGCRRRNGTKIKVTPPERKDLEALAKVYLTRMMSAADMEKFVKGTLSDEAAKLIKADIPQDEQKLYDNIKDDNYLKAYLGKKAVTRLGCYACHDIPGFENAKSIGVGLNDWGKKAPERLAFEDISNFFNSHYYPVDSITGKDGKSQGGKDGLNPTSEVLRRTCLLGPQGRKRLSEPEDPRSAQLRLQSHAGLGRPGAHAEIHLVQAAEEGWGGRDRVRGACIQGRSRGARGGVDVRSRPGRRASAVQEHQSTNR